MPSLKSIRKRIVSVKNTQKITKAMKMVAAAKLRRAQEAVVAVRPYARRMKGVVHDLVSRVGDDLDLGASSGDEAPEVLTEGGEGEARAQVVRDQLRLLRTGEEQRVLLVAVTSDRGLAGAFNSNVNRRVERFLVEQAGKQVQVVGVGKKGRDYLKRRKIAVVQEYLGADPKTAAERAAQIAAYVCDAVMKGEVDAVYVAYNEFKNAASQTLRVERLLPLKDPPKESTGDEPPRALTDFVYEPDQRQVLAHLIPLQVETELLRLMLESIASEMGARMSAMDNASRNAKEMIGRLTLQYNRARQAAITKELMEIIGGAEALKG